ncbi:hypothetical protein [Secundilactobacillus muriivasis]
MKTGANKLLELIDYEVETYITGLKTIYLATVTGLSPLTVQSRALNPDGKKQAPIQDVRQLDFEYYIKGSEDDGHTRELKVGDEVVVAVFADSIANYEKGKNFTVDPYRRNSVDSSVIMGVLK